MARQIRNLGASIRARLLNIARERGQPFDVVLTMFALERLLYRLAESKHADRFVLKGAMLLTTWLPNFERPTRDIDFLGFGSNSPESMVETFKDPDSYQRSALRGAYPGRYRYRLWRCDTSGDRGDRPP
jgi:hypothetical protein